MSSHHGRDRLERAESSRSRQGEDDMRIEKVGSQESQPTDESLARRRADRHARFAPLDRAHDAEKAEDPLQVPSPIDTRVATQDAALPRHDPESNPTIVISQPAPTHHYTDRNRLAPPKTFLSTLKPYVGRINHENWFKVALRPFILYAYPSILWSSAIYALSVGWLIVLSESATTIFRGKDSYHFTALQTGLVYISPFIGGILGTAVAGKVSDIIVRAMANRNGGIYEPEFRLIMALPVALCTTIGLMGYGWSAQERDNFWVPTVFFGIISFGCTLGSTTAITFAVDSYRQYAGEALVTLNFTKNIFHGLVFSLFFNKWLDADGSKDVFVALGGIQLAILLTTVPMYVYGKRARMWTVRRDLMEKF
ncbi:MAG: hypothetical protein M1828_006308 [Chrysothrix sp. TS-e1954]|nr:MAG: hypothetical protein M1828_006308 [Chrysothrix sp. TS-e1954]